MLHHRRRLLVGAGLHFSLPLSLCIVNVIFGVVDVWLGGGQLFMTAILLARRATTPAVLDVGLRGLFQHVVSC